MILKEDVEKVRAAADLYDIVSASVTLRPSGTGTFVGLCPFHDEKTPSFSVRPALGVWHCFGCGLGGDVFGYVEHQENIDFREAVELLADKYHIELHYEHSGSKRARLIEANEEAQRFFMSQIMSKEALAARKLLGGRNFSRADCERFGCGYAPQGWDNLVRYLASKGFTQQEMLDAGLAAPHGRFVIRPGVRSALARASCMTTIRSPRSTSTRRTPSCTVRRRCCTASTWRSRPS